MGQIMSRKWVRVWVKENPESPAVGTDSGSPNGGVKCTKPVSGKHGIRRKMGQERFLHRF